MYVYNCCCRLFVNQLQGKEMRKGAAAMTSSPAAEEGDEEMEDDVMAENWKVMRGQSAHESPTPGVIYFRPRKFV